MTKEEFAARMQKIADSGSGDIEINHSMADDLIIECLRALGYGEGCDIYDKIDKWYA